VIPPGHPTSGTTSASKQPCSDKYELIEAEKAVYPIIVLLGTGPDHSSNGSSDCDGNWIVVPTVGPSGHACS
jgi:hypothetical protein